MKVKELIAKLSEMDPEKEVELSVGWAGDTATADEGDDPTVQEKDGLVQISGWMSNCGTELHWGDD